ncbi:Elongation of very long chain fatty acids protein, partial [Caligus rogercresseyi]
VKQLSLILSQDNFSSKNRGKMYMSHWETRDVRLDNWPLMSSLWPTLVLSAPISTLSTAMMKGFMNLYNLVQIYGSMYMFINFLKGGWYNDYNLR